MFTIRMYNFNKKLNSTKKPNVVGTSFSCEMKTSSSILFPVVEIRTSNNNRQIPLYNYAYIQEFQRYYWIDDPLSERDILISWRKSPGLSALGDDFVKYLLLKRSIL